MTCPQCKHTETQVIDSRDCPDGVRRRRACLECHCRFTTYERMEIPLVVVIKKNNDRERFDPDKIKKGVRLSCKNRPITTAHIERLVEEVTQRVYLLGKDEITSKEVGGIVQEFLQKLDEVAYMRFTSVHQAFASVGEFEREIHNIH